MMLGSVSIWAWWHTSIRGHKAPMQAPAVLVHSDDRAVLTRAAPVAPVIRRWIDGQPLPEGTAQPFAVAVVVDNASEARPQSGLSEAPIVVEVPVEGRRTRFVVFASLDGALSELGPVRSARPYLIGIARHFGVPLVHVGGSPEALTLFRDLRLFHVNQYYDPPFWRSRSRPAPFNVYTAVDRLAAFVRARAQEQWKRQPLPLLPYVESVPSTQGSVAAQLRITYSAAHVVEWRYDAERAVYVRSQDGRPHRDAAGHSIEAVNVLVLEVRSRVLDAMGRLRIPDLDPRDRTAGDGGKRTAIVMTRGRRVDGFWNWHAEQNADPPSAARIRFRPSVPSDAPTVLQVGNTWIEIVDQGTAVQ